MDTFKRQEIHARKRMNTKREEKKGKKKIMEECIGGSGGGRSAECKLEKAMSSRVSKQRSLLEALRFRKDRPWL